MIDHHTPRRIATAGALLAAALGALPVGAAIVPYTDFDAYLADIAALALEQVRDGDSIPAPLTINDGDKLGDVTFADFDMAGDLLQIIDQAGATSSDDNALATNNGALLEESAFSITLNHPVLAFGLFVISADNLIDDNVVLTFGSGLGDVGLAVGDAITGSRLSDEFDFAASTNLSLYFIGGIASTPFSRIAVASDDNGSFNWYIDDLRSSAAPTAAPLAPTLALLVPGLLGLGFHRSRARARRNQCRRADAR